MEPTAMDRRTPEARGMPWTPDEAEPLEGWPPAPGAIPMVVAEWEPAGGGGSAGAGARPHPRSVPRAAVSCKDDAAHGRERLRRFVAAWRWIERVRTEAAPGRADLGAAECNAHLAGAGVLLRVRPPRTTPGRGADSKRPIRR
jgi:hypothetical protein